MRIRTRGGTIVFPSLASVTAFPLVVQWQSCKRKSYPSKVAIKCKSSFGYLGDPNPSLLCNLRIQKSSLMGILEYPYIWWALNEKLMCWSSKALLAELGCLEGWPFLFRVCRVGLQVFSALYFPILARPWRVEDGLFLGFMWNKQRDSARPRCPLKPLCDSRWTKKSRYSLPFSFCLSWRKMTTRQWRRFSRERQFCTPVTQS